MIGFFPMHNVDVRRCSYFELGLPVVSRIVRESCVTRVKRLLSGPEYEQNAESF